LAQACTTFPAKVQSKNGEILWDTPGFGDNKGIEQELLNAYYIRRLMDCHKSVRTVFVVAFHQIQGAAKDFIDGLAAVLHMFESVPDFKSHLTLVVTGVDQGIQPQDLKGMIKHKILASKDLKRQGIEEVMMYLSNMVGRDAGLIVMHKPSFPTSAEAVKVPLEDTEYDEFIQTLRKGINVSRRITNLPRTKVVVSSDAKEALKQSCGKQIKDLAAQFRTFIEKVKHHERNDRLGQLRPSEESILGALRQMENFDLFRWLSHFKDKSQNLSALTSVSRWTAAFRFPKDILRRARCQLAH